MDNQVFVFKRFQMFFRKELREYFSKYGVTLLSMMGAYLLFWVLQIIFPSATPVHIFARIFTICFFILVIMVCAPAKCYGTITDKRVGLLYAMLPVSALEKTLSMFLINSVVTLCVSLVGLFGLDSLLTILTPSVFDQFLFESPLVKNLWLDLVLSVIALQSLFVLGNVLFKKNKIGTTTALIIVMSLVLSFMFMLVVHAIGDEKIMLWFTEAMGDAIKELNVFDVEQMSTLPKVLRQSPSLRVLMILEYGTTILYTLACWWGTNRRIKTIKY